MYQELLYSFLLTSILPQKAVSYYDSLMVMTLFLVSHLNLFTDSLQPVYTFFFSLPILFTLCVIYLSVCVHRAITGYFSLAFTELNKADLSEYTLTDRYKHMYSHSTHTCSEPDESLILRSPSCAGKKLSQLIHLLKNSMFCSVPALL